MLERILRPIAIFPILRAAALCVVFFVVEAKAQGLDWWTTHVLVKVRPNDPPPPSRSQAAELFAARNEFEPFQIVLRAAGADLEGVDVEVTDLKAADGSVLGSSEVMIYLEHYIALEQPSSEEGEAGEWPDPLIPRIDRYAGERRNAFPFRLVRGRNQPIWIEVYVPLDASPGDYSGQVRITATGVPEVTVPVTLRVWNFALPSTSTLPTSFGLNGVGALKEHRGDYTSDEELQRFTVLYAKAALWHRISIHAGTMNPPPFVDGKGKARVDWSQYDREVGPFLNGKVFGPRDPLPGARWTSVDLRTPSGADTDAKKVLYWKEWLRHFSEKGWLDRLFHYVWDEPPVSDYPKVAERARLARRADRRVRNLVTAPLNPLLATGIDIWTPLINCLESKPGFPDFCDRTVPRQAYEAALQKGNSLWWYQSCASHGCDNVGGDYFRGWPSYVIDAPALGNRIMPWLAWKFRVAGELYYNMNEAFAQKADPWKEVNLFGGNGDGTLFYPGQPDRIGGDTDIPIESLRLKLIREGLEDYEYLFLLAEWGLSGCAEDAVSRLVQKAYQWEHDPGKFYAVRREVGERLHQAIRLTRPENGDGVRGSRRTPPQYPYRPPAGPTDKRCLDL